MPGNAMQFIGRRGVFRKSARILTNFDANRKENLQSKIFCLHLQSQTEKDALVLTFETSFLIYFAARARRTSEEEGSLLV